MRRRKNAGEGYGYMFHGAFTDKADAVKKEKQTKGSFVKGAITKHGYRWLVMSPRTNPIKRKRRRNSSVAKEILEQLGGRKFSTMTGAKTFTSTANSLTFRLPSSFARDGINLVQITLDDSDTYTIKFMHTRGHDLRTVAERSGVYNDNLRDVFTSVTGLDTSMGSMGRANPGRPFMGPGGVHYSGRRPGGKQYESKIFDTSTTKGLMSAERYKARLQNKYEHVNVHAIGLNRVQIVGMRSSEDRGENPSELLILGANPTNIGEHVRDLTIPAGSTITIRTNPLQSNPMCGAAIGGGERCTRMPGHKGPHLPQGATLRPRSRLRAAWKPRAANPSAAAIREDFTGSPAEKFFLEDAPGIPKGDYAQLGELLALYVKPIAGGQVQHIDFRHSRPLLISDESRRQIYFLGGDQDISGSLETFAAGEGSATAAGIVELGEARRIDYKQRKEHVPDPDVDEWRHEFGEESGVRPTLYFDGGLKRLILKGGEYEIRREGIVN